MTQSVDIKPLFQKTMELREARRNRPVSRECNIVPPNTRFVPRTTVNEVQLFYRTARIPLHPILSSGSFCHVSEMNTGISSIKPCSFVRKIGSIDDPTFVVSATDSEVVPGIGSRSMLTRNAPQQLKHFVILLGTASRQLGHRLRSMFPNALTSA
jgi:hypothetical protein